MENVQMCELSQKGPQVRYRRKLQFFSIFLKLFKKEENLHTFTPGQLKYKNSLIWMENVYMCELSQKGPQLDIGRKPFTFFDFFRKWRKSWYFHSRTTTI